MIKLLNYLPLSDYISSCLLLSSVADQHQLMHDRKCIQLSVHLSIHLSIYLSIYLSINLSIHLSTYINLSIYLIQYPHPYYIVLSFCLSLFFLFSCVLSFFSSLFLSCCSFLKCYSFYLQYLPIHPSIFPSIHPST